MNEYASVLCVVSRQHNKYIDSRIYYIRRENRKHISLDKRYNFILHLILHFTDFYFNYIPTIFNTLAPEFPFKL